jgi:hypothetical protein
LAPAIDLFANQNIQILAQRFVDPNRHTLTAATFIKHFVGFGGWEIPHILFYHARSPWLASPT